MTKFNLIFYIIFFELMQAKNIMTIICDNPKYLLMKYNEALRHKYDYGYISKDNPLR